MQKILWNSWNSCLNLVFAIAIIGLTVVLWVEKSHSAALRMNSSSHRRWRSRGSESSEMQRADGMVPAAQSSVVGHQAASASSYIIAVESGVSRSSSAGDEEEAPSCA